MRRNTASFLVSFFLLGSFINEANATVKWSESAGVADVRSYLEYQKGAGPWRVVLIEGGKIRDPEMAADVAAFLDMSQAELEHAFAGKENQIFRDEMGNVEDAVRSLRGIQGACESFGAQKSQHCLAEEEKRREIELVRRDEALISASDIRALGERIKSEIQAGRIERFNVGAGIEVRSNSELTVQSGYPQGQGFVISGPSLDRQYLAVVMNSCSEPHTVIGRNQCLVIQGLPTEEEAARAKEAMDEINAAGKSDKRYVDYYNARLLKINEANRKSGGWGARLTGKVSGYTAKDHDLARIDIEQIFLTQIKGSVNGKKYCVDTLDELSAAKKNRGYARAFTTAVAGGHSSTAECLTGLLAACKRKYPHGEWITAMSHSDPYGRAYELFKAAEGKEEAHHASSRRPMRDVAKAKLEELIRGQYEVASDKAKFCSEKLGNIYAAIQVLKEKPGDGKAFYGYSIGTWVQDEVKFFGRTAIQTSLDTLFALCSGEKIESFNRTVLSSREPSGTVSIEDIHRKLEARNSEIDTKLRRNMSVFGAAQVDQEFLRRGELLINHPQYRDPERTRIDGDRHTENFQRAWGDAIANGNRFIDVTTLSMPEGKLKDELIRSIVALSRKARDHDITVRLLFGSDMRKAQGNTIWERYDIEKGIVKPLQKALSGEPGIQDSKLHVYVGTYDASYQAPSSSHTKTPMSWNHSKIVAADGQTFFTGGTNLYNTYTRDTNPVHDLSAQVPHPDLALVGHRFVDRLWQETIRLSGGVKKLGFMPAEQTGADESHHAAADDRVGADEETKKGYLETLSSKLTSAATGATDAVQSMAAHQKFGKIWSINASDDHVPLYITQPEQGADHAGEGSPRAKPRDTEMVMAVGRLGNAGNDRSQASDNAMVEMINGAKQSVMIAQQAVLPLFLYTQFTQNITNALARKIKQGVDVFVLTSPLDPAVVGEDMLGYSSSWSKSRFFYFMLNEMNKTGGNPQTNADLLLKHFHINFTSNGVAEVPNHSKVLIVDKSVSYEGSHNLYDDSHAEMGMIFGRIGTERLINQYFAPFWHVSAGASRQGGMQTKPNMAYQQGEWVYMRRHPGAGGHGENQEWVLGQVTKSGEDGVYVNPHPYTQPGGSGILLGNEDVRTIPHGGVRDAGGDARH